VSLQSASSYANASVRSTGLYSSWSAQRSTSRQRWCAARTTASPSTNGRSACSSTRWRSVPSPFKGRNRNETFQNVLQKEVELPGRCWIRTPRGGSGTPTGQRSMAPKSCCPAACPGGWRGSRGTAWILL
jgi:hypothetical protein